MPGNQRQQAEERVGAEGGEAKQGPEHSGLQSRVRPDGDGGDR